MHRLTWQRVWLLPPPSPDQIVRHIAWRPDGRVIAIAYVQSKSQANVGIKVLIGTTK